jgi:hypothetical protein
MTDVPAADSANGLSRYPADRANEFQRGLNADFFRNKLRKRFTLILLDGLDEAPHAARREAVVRLFERTTNARRNARLVVTTRPTRRATAVPAIALPLTDNEGTQN